MALQPLNIGLQIYGRAIHLSDFCTHITIRVLRLNYVRLAPFQLILKGAEGSLLLLKLHLGFLLRRGALGLQLLNLLLVMNSCVF